MYFLHISVHRGVETSTKELSPGGKNLPEFAPLWAFRILTNTRYGGEVFQFIYNPCQRNARWYSITFFRQGRRVSFLFHFLITKYKENI